MRTLKFVVELSCYYSTEEHSPLGEWVARVPELEVESFPWTPRRYGEVDSLPLEEMIDDLAKKVSQKVGNPPFELVLGVKLGEERGEH